MYIFLNLGSRLCITALHKDNVNTFKHYIDVFNTDPTSTIIEAALNLKNTDTRRIKGQHFWKTTTSERLIDKFDKILSLELDKFDILSSPTSDLLPRLANIKEEQLRNQLGHCLNNNKCKELQRFLEHLGN